MSAKPGSPSGDGQSADDRARDAQATLDALRHEAGGALTPKELRERHGIEGDDQEVPLDWRLTPANVILQLLAAAVALAVVGFLGWLVWDGVRAIFLR